VVEVGPGPGGLTRALLETDAASVVAVERDARAVNALGGLSLVYGERLRIVEGDALALDLRELAEQPRRVVANLPYNVSIPLLLGWLRQAGDWDGFTLMFQREVAGRLGAKPGTKSYGRLSVITQWLCDVRRDFNVDKRAFTPPPKVMSTVVTLTPRPRPLAEASWGALERVTQAAFGQRRKMLRSSLKPIGLDPGGLGLDPTARAEELTVEEFCALARALAESET